MQNTWDRVTTPLAELAFAFTKNPNAQDALF